MRSHQVPYPRRAGTRRPRALRHRGRPSVEVLEARPPPAVPPTATILDDNFNRDEVLTLREALAAANTDMTVGDALHDGTGGTDVIAFDPAVFAAPQTISLVFGELRITGSVVIA